ncbi:hypothetical protein ACHAXR_002222 [Thalassiosira sp. AJA248-18]
MHFKSSAWSSPINAIVLHVRDAQLDFDPDFSEPVGEIPVERNLDGLQPISLQGGGGPDLFTSLASTALPPSQFIALNVVDDWTPTLAPATAPPLAPTPTITIFSLDDTSVSVSSPSDLGAGVFGRDFVDASDLWMSPPIPTN